MGDPKDIRMVHFLCKQEISRNSLLHKKDTLFFIPGTADKFMVTTTFFN